MDVPKHNVGILLFPQVELLDFAGPYEVFSRTRLTPGVESRRDESSAPYNVFTVAEEETPITSVGGLVVTPKYDFSSAPAIDILVIPGGSGTRALLKDKVMLEWIRRVHEQQATITASVCTGALLLAQVGILTGKRATTHWCAHDTLAQMDASIQVQRNQRVVKDTVYTSAGVSAGIDMSLQVVEDQYGRAIADETAKYIEFQRR